MLNLVNAFFSEFILAKTHEIDGVCVNQGDFCTKFSGRGADFKKILGENLKLYDLRGGLCN
jgi:hypothetical protein